MEAIYNHLKKQSKLDSANLVYITVVDNHYSFFAQPVSLKKVDKEKTILQIKNISERKDFFSFTHTEKGKKFMKEHQEKITAKLTETFFGTEGLMKN